MQLSRLARALVTVFAFTLTTGASEQGSSKLTFSGTIGYDMGQIVKGRYQGETFDHVWEENTVGYFGVKAVANERLTFRFGMQGRVWFNTFPQQTIKEYNAGSNRYVDFDVREAEGIYSLLKGSALSLGAAFGIMQYKYNPDATDMGEYLFRSGTYPAYLINQFDYTAATLSGFGFNLQYTSGAFGLKFDQFILTETQIRPFHDVTLASIVNANFMKIVDIGAGVSFAHLISVDSRLTAPENPFGQYIKSITPRDTTFDTTYGYNTFKGTKIMARISLDPLFFLRESSAALFIGQGGKLYSELAILGLESYPATVGNPWGYDTLSQKIPIMIGLTIPMPKFLMDAVSLEFEHYSCPYPDDYAQVFQKGWPIPTQGVQPVGEYNLDTYRNDSWKWSLFASKQITPNIRLCGQVGRDHQRWEAHISHLRNYDFEDAAVKPDQWLWHFKVEYKY